MTPVMSTTGLVLHELGLATAFGGSLFGKIALNPAVRTLPSLEERGKVVNTAWGGFNILNVLSLGTASVTWLIGRSQLTGREIDDTTQSLVCAKDALLGASVVLGVANVAAEAYLTRQAIDGAVPMESGNRPAFVTPTKAANALRAINVMGIVNLACLAGVIGVTAFLNMKAGTSSRWSALTRFLP